MATLNKVMLIGRLTDNPEAPRTLPSGNTVVKFRFAVGRSRKNPQTGQWENDPNPLYIDCEAYSRADARRNLPELIYQYARKGDPLYIEGRLQLDQWEDKNGGGKRFKHKVVVESIEFLGSRNPDGINPAAGRINGNRTPPPEDDAADNYGAGPSDSPAHNNTDDDPIPF
jgi:single-strand DNA-binding protein